MVHLFIVNHVVELLRIYLGSYFKTFRVTGHCGCLERSSSLCISSLLNMQDFLNLGHAPGTPHDK